MTSPTQQGLIRAVLDIWKSRGWRDVDQSALEVALSLQSGASGHEASKRVSGRFLEHNGIRRADVAAAVADVDRERSAAPPELTAVVLTAIPCEYAAVVGQLSEVRQVTTANGTRYVVGPVPGEGCVWNVAVAEIGPGNLAAAAEVTAAATEFDPNLFLFVGVAGSLKDDVTHGTVVVADRVHFYERGKDQDDGWRARPQSYPAPHRLVQTAISLSREWESDTVIIKPIAAGEVLVVSKDSGTAKTLDSHYNDSVAVDMESAGVYAAAHRIDRPGLAIRGISDMLDDKSAEADAQRQPAAAANAARFAIGLLRVTGPQDL